jgi:hypothetical protein
MPLTWFAHQTPVIGAKLARPSWFDATAACVGSMVPDMMYSFSGYLHIDSHEWLTAMAYGIPITIVMAALVRWVVAPGGVPYLPDCGGFRVRSWAVLDRRRPPPMITLVSAVLGIASHIAIDSFTHPQRPGVRWLGYEDVSVDLFGHTEPLAGVFQMIGHTFGSVAAVGMLLWIGRRRLLERWYGETAVVAARRRSRTIGPDAFWATVCASAVAGLAWGWGGGDRAEALQRPAVGTFAGLAIASALALRAARRSAEHAGGDLAE